MSYLTFLILSFSLLVAAQVDSGFNGGPANATNVKTITSPGGVTIRYKEPGQDGVCETTKGVNSYAGYVDLDNATHMFFYFVEARINSGSAPLTLWLNGGPGSDSLIGLFQELGPCNVTAELKTELNPYAWNEVSNMLFLSQPIGVGFSYSEELHDLSGTFGDVDPSALASTTDMAAVGVWHVLQGFLANLPQMDSEIKVKDFNLWTESYGGHYGPAFFSYFSDQNRAIANGTQKGVQLVMASLGIGNGIIDEAIQAPYYPEFAVNNTYGIKAVSDEVYLEMKAAFYDPGMCKDQVAACAASDHSSLSGKATCQNASDTCRTYVEGPYYNFGNGPYDIRDVPTPPDYFESFLNLASTQNSFGVNLNYTASNVISEAFEETGDFVYGEFIGQLGSLLDSGVRVALYAGDADYICNWLGGEAVSLQINYTHREAFRSAGYAPFVVDGVEYGEVRQYGNFSFLRIYESGHEVPYYQPKASLEFFRRVLGNKVVADGLEDVSASYASNGTAEATHRGDIVISTSTSSTTSSAGTGTETGTTTSSVSGAIPSPSKSSGQRRVHMFWRSM